MMMNKMGGKSCYYCGPTDKELRPYGPNMSFVCFPCAMLPGNVATTDAQFEQQLNAAGPLACIGEETGPRPFIQSAGQ